MRDASLVQHSFCYRHNELLHLCHFRCDDPSWRPFADFLQRIPAETNQTKGNRFLHLSIFHLLHYSYHSPTIRKRGWVLGSQTCLWSYVQTHGAELHDLHVHDCVRSISNFLQSSCYVSVAVCIRMECNYCTSLKDKFFFFYLMSISD